MTKKLIPNQQLLVQIRGKITDFPNKQGEYKRQIHYGLFLLCHQAGLRVSEAVNFDLTTKSKKGLYRINRPKGKKERFVYIPKEVIKELKKQN
jgi:integrase